jgi:hypothetical protein
MQSTTSTGAAVIVIERVRKKKEEEEEEAAERASCARKFDILWKDHDSSVMEKYIVPTQGSTIAPWPACDVHFQHLLYYLGCFISASAGDGIRLVSHGRLVESINKATQSLAELQRDNAERLARLSDSSRSLSPWGSCQNDAFIKLRLQHISEEYSRLKRERPVHSFHVLALTAAHSAANLQLATTSSLLQTASDAVTHGHYPPYGYRKTYAELRAASIST